MTSLMQNRIAVAVAVLVPSVVALWLWTTAAAAVPSTYAFVALLVLSMALVGFNTWSNSQPTGSLAQVIHEAEDHTRDGALRPADRGGRTPRAYLARSRRCARARGRVRGVLALSAAVTVALLLYAWIM